MTIGELIQELQAFPVDMPVFIQQDNCCCVGERQVPESIGLIEAYQQEENKGQPGPAQYTGDYEEFPEYAVNGWCRHATEGSNPMELPFEERVPRRRCPQCVEAARQERPPVKCVRIQM